MVLSIASKPWLGFQSGLNTGISVLTVPILGSERGFQRVIISHCYEKLAPQLEFSLWTDFSLVLGYGGKSPIFSGVKCSVSPKLHSVEALYWLSCLCAAPQTFLRRGNHWIWANSLPCQNTSTGILRIWVRLRQVLEYYLQIGVLLELLIPSPFACFHSGFPAVSGRWDKKGNPSYLEELCFFHHMLFKAILSRQENNKK